MRRAVLIAAALLALAACGRKGTLRLAPDQKPVPAGYGRSAFPTTDQALKPPPDAGPERVDDVIKRPEQPRAADPFDLPPPG